MYSVRSLLSLASLALASLASGLEPGALPAILDAPELSFELEVHSGSANASAAQSFAGGSSLVVRPSYDADEQKHCFNIELGILAAGPGRLTLSARSENCAPGHFSVNRAPAHVSLPEGAEPGEWHRASFLIQPGSERIEISIATCQPTADAALYFDDIVFEPGVEILLDDIPAAGAISLAPAKSMYAVGETVSVTVAPVPGVTVESIAELDRFNGIETLRPASFALTAAKHVTLRPRYRQRVEISGFDADILLQSSLADVAGGAPFAAFSIAIHDVPAGTLLAFEADMLGGREIRVAGDGIEYEGEPRFERYPTDWGWIGYHVFVEHPAERLDVEVFGDSIGPDRRYLPFRNIGLARDREIALTTRGRGTASATYEDVPAPETTLAKLVAIPDPGWEFSGWEGFASSSDAETTLLIDAPRHLEAVFAQVFEFGPSRWEFKHDGSARVELAADGKGIRIEPGDEPSTVIADVVVHGAGDFSATTYVFDDEGEPTVAPSPTFESTLRVGSAPLRVREAFYLDGDRVFEIRDIIVSGGSGYDDIEVRVTAPEGSISISPLKERYVAGDPLSLSVKPDWLDRFVGWHGDRHSAEPELDIELDGPLAIEAVFRAEATAAGGRQVASTGTAIMPIGEGADGIEFQETELLPGQWTEIQIEVVAPVTVALEIGGGFTYSGVTYKLGDQTLAVENRIERDGLVYCSIPEGAAGPLRVRFWNASDSATTASARVAGFFQDAAEWVPFGLRSKVQLEPSTRFIPIGAVVSVEAEAMDGEDAFVGWQGREETESSFTFAVAEGARTILYPRYESNGAIPGITFLPESSVGWQKIGADRFMDGPAYDGEASHSVSIDIQGPGVLSFNYTTSSEPGLTDLQVLIDGEPIPVREYGISAERALEALVPEGARAAQIVTTLSDYALENQLQPYGGQLSDFAFQPGYAVVGEPGHPYPASVEGAASVVFAPGSAITIAPKHMPAGEFSSWRGDLAGRGEIVSLILDRHIVANGAQRPTRAVGTVIAKISDNAIFSAAQGGDQSIDYYIESASGLTTLTFTVPAMRELAFELRYADCLVQARVDGGLVYSGEPGDIEFGFPVKESPQTITLTLDLDPEEDRQVWVIGVRSSGAFALYGDFGDASEFVTAEPFKDVYAPGEKVTVKLTPEAPSDWVFYDVAALLPNLGLLEWIQTEGARSFEVEIVSETALLGNVGPMPTRTSGQITTSQNLLPIGTSDMAPDGRSASRFQLADADGSYLRIYCPGARHVDFWINAPVDQDWYFPDALIDGAPIAFEGSGDWQQLSLPVPTGASYLSAFLSYRDSNANTFQISQTRPKTGYGIPFIATPGGRIEQTPAAGAASADSVLTLKAIPQSGYSFARWGIDDAGLATSFSGKPSETPILVPAFAKDAIFLDLLGTIVEVTGSAPSRVEGSKTLVFQNTGDAIALEVEGPGRITYSTEHATQYGSLHATLEGAHLYHHRHHAIHGNPSAPEIRIPAGRHVLELEYSESDDEASSTLHGLSFERGAYLDVPQYFNGGTVSASPDKRFFQIGESYTLTATPEFDQAFAGWTGDLPTSAIANPLTRSISDHTSVGARFAYDQTASNDGLEWRVRAVAGDPDIRSGAVVVEGPGYFLIDRTLREAPGFAARVDGLVFAPIDTHLGAVIPVSQGKHRLGIVAAASAESFAWGAQFVPGWLFALSGEADALDIAPRQESYLRGAVVELSLPALHPRAVALDGSALEPGESRAYPIQQHTVVQASSMIEIGSGLRSNAAPGRVRFASEGGAQPYLSILPDPDLRAIIEARFAGPGELAIDLLAAEHARVALYLDGAFVAELEGGAARSFAIGSDEVTARLSIDWRNVGWSAQPVTIRSIHFTPSDPEPFALWMSRALPASVYALGAGLGPDDDLDGDGRSNLEEREAGSDPDRFDVENLAMLAPASGPALRFDLPASLDRARVSVLRWVESDGLKEWRSTALDDTAREVEAVFGDRQRITVPTRSIDPDARLFRIAIAE